MRRPCLAKKKSPPRTSENPSLERVKRHEKDRFTSLYYLAPRAGVKMKAAAFIPVPAEAQPRRD
jgi:hypothetical protein